MVSPIYRTLLHPCLLLGMMLGLCPVGAPAQQSPKPPAGGAPSGADHPTAVSVVPFKTPSTAPLPLVTLSIGDGPSALFIIDPGTPRSLIDPNFVDKAQIPTSQINLGAQSVTETANPDEIVIKGTPDMKLRRIPFLISDMTPIRRVLGPGSEVVGVLGADLLGVFAERIDFSAHTLSFYPTGHAPTAGLQGHRLPLDEGASGFSLTAQVDGKPIRFQIDFLYQDTDIQEDGPFNMLKPLAQLKDIGPADAVLGQTLRLQFIQFGDLTWLNPVVKHTVVAAPQENFLGLDFYTQFVVTLDLRAKQISLETDPNYKEDLAKWLSTGFKAIPGPDGAPIVGSITTPSPASEAGLKAGDEILEINGLSTATNSPAQLAATVKRTEGAVVTLKIQRTGEEKPKEFSLKVRKLL